MLKKIVLCFLTLSLVGFVFVVNAMAGAAFVGDTIPRMEVGELFDKLDFPDIMIIDVRRGSDWEGSELMIKNGVRKAYNDVDGWAGDVPRDKTLVLYCA